MCVCRVLRIINFICATCGVEVAGVWNHNAQRYEPSSHYWYAEKPGQITAVHCNPTCMLIHFHTRNKLQMPHWLAPCSGIENS